MGKLIRYIDDARACFARVDWISRESAFISIAQTGVLIKRSRYGIFGAKLYVETNINNCLEMSRVLDNVILSRRSLSYLPKALTDQVLRSFTRLAIETNSALEFRTGIEEAKRLVLEGNRQEQNQKHISEHLDIRTQE